MNFSTYFAASVMLMIGTVYYAFYSYRQFYPTVLFLVSSKTAYIVTGNLVLAVGLMIARIFKNLFFGQLRDTEVELLVDTAKYTIPETCLALTIFRNELTPTVGILFGALIFIKLLHKLSKCRVEYQEQLLPIPLGAQMRVYTLLTALSVIDLAGTFLSVMYVYTYGRSVIILFGFEFGLLILYTINMSVRFVIQILDSLSEAGIPSKGLYLMLTDVVCEVVKFITYVCLFALVFYYYGIPIHILRDVYMSFLSCQRKVMSFVKYMQLTRNLDSRFQDATPEELAAAGNCLVCHEALTQGKKLQCGHVFHLDCLRMWLQHQQICPLCRANITVENSAAAAVPAVADGAAAALPGAVPADGQAVPGAVVAADGAAPNAVVPAAQPIAGAALPAVLVPNAATAPAPVNAAPNGAPPAPASSAASRIAASRVNTSSSSASTPGATKTPAAEPNGPRVFGVPLSREQLARAASTAFPAFCAVLGEPDVAVLQDPMLGAEVTRRIEAGTIVFVTAKVQGGDGTVWVKVPGGWILESQQPQNGASSGPVLYSVVPMSDSKAPSITEAAPASRMSEVLHQSGEKAAFVPQGSGKSAAVVAASESAEPRFYSRSAARSSRLLDELETKRPSETTKPSAEHEAPGASSSFPASQTPRSPVLSPASTEQAIEEHLLQLRLLLDQHRGGQYDHLHDALNTSSSSTSPLQRKGQSYKDTDDGPSQRLRQLATMQVHMEQVTRNLAALSENVLHSHNALSRMIQGEIDSAEPETPQAQEPQS